METIRRKCIETVEIAEDFSLKKGKEYDTMKQIQKGMVCVFSKYWFWIDGDVFEKEIKNV